MLNVMLGHGGCKPWQQAHPPRSCAFPSQAKEEGE